MIHRVAPSALGSTLSSPIPMTCSRQISNSSLQNTQDLQKRAIAWIKRPPGDLSPEDWFGIEDDMEVLLTQNTLDSVELSFHLLDRLAMEQRVISSLTRAEWVNGEFIKKLLQNWFMLFRQDQSLPKKFVEQYHPSIVSEAIDRYCSAFHEVKWSSQAGYYIIAAFNALAKSQSRHSSQSSYGLDFTTKIFQKIIQEWKKGNEDATPAPALFQAVANACTSRTIPAKDRQRAATLLDDLLLMVAKGSDHPPDAQLFAQSINAWALTRSTKGAQKAIERLDQMYQTRRLQQEAVPGWVWVNALRSAVNAWTWSNHKDTLRQVEVLLVRTQNFVESGLITQGESTVPVWNAALQACAVAASQEGAAKAMKIAEIFDQAETPDKNTFYWYIASLVNGGEIDKGEKLFTESIQTGLLEAREDFLAMVMYGWVRSRHPQKYKRAKNLCEKAQQLSKGKLRLTTLTYNSLLECCAQSSEQGQYQYFANEALRLIELMRSLAIQKNDDSIAPDLKSYTSAIRCLAYCGDGKRAEILLYELMAAYKKSGNRRLQPDPVIFNTVLSAYNNSKDEDALQGAQEFFQKFLEMHRKGDISKGPDRYSFTTLISCIARANGEGKVAIERAKIASGLLRQLHSLYSEENNVDWQPSTVTYNAVMNCWAKAGSPGNCEATLEKMLNDHRNGNGSAPPDIQSFNILMKALASCSLPNAGKRADDLLSRIKDLHRGRILGSGPNTITYSTLILCHIQSGSPEGIDRAEAILREMELQHEKGDLSSPPNDNIYEMVRKAKDAQLVSPDLPQIN